MKHCVECQSVNPDGSLRCLVCGDEFPIGAAKLVDGRYETTGELGRGANGVVWGAMDVALRRAVALKFLAPQLTRRPEAVRRFQREAAALASIRSDHVARVYSFGIDGQSFFFAMELVEGQTCNAIIEGYAQNGELIPVHRALVILIELARGLAAVHSAGIVHRDVKPHNVVVEKGSGRTVLVDFGLALPGEVAREARVVGSPAYMAPEQIRGNEKLTSRTDVYALGCSAFHMLTNELVFPTRDVQQMLAKQLLDSPPLVSTVRPELKPLDDVIRRALEKDPEDRYASCTEMAHALELAGVQWLRPNRIQSSGSIEPGAEQPVAARILVVDDDDDFAKLSVRASQIAFFGTSASVARARSGEEALEDAARKPPQLVLLDYHMPGMNGVETLSRLRGLPGAANARVLVITAKAGELDRWRFDALGIDGFLRKPIELRELVDVIGALARARGWIAMEEDGRETS